MSIAVTLPAKLVGLFKPARTPSHADYPTLTWWLEPLPQGNKSFTDIEFGEGHMDDPHWQAEWTQRTAQLRSMRPEAVSWVGFERHQGGADTFKDTAITELVYSWLEHDLRNAFWFR